MSDSLICPECGREQKPAGQTAGQRFPCPWCKAVIVVPALARTIKRGRRIATPRERPLERGRETSWRVWASLGGGLLALLLLAFVVKWTFALRARQVQMRAVEDRAAQAKAFARAQLRRGAGRGSGRDDRGGPDRAQGRGADRKVARSVRSDHRQRRQGRVPQDRRPRAEQKVGAYRRSGRRSATTPSWLAMRRSPTHGSTRHTSNGAKPM